MSSAVNVSDSSQVPKWHIHRRMYDWVLHWAHTPYGLPALVLIAFVESSIFPIPPDVLIVALTAGAVHKWWKFAAWATGASVLGGILGYAIGMFFWETAGQWIVTNLIHISMVPVDGRMDIKLPSYLVQVFGDGLGGQYLFQVYDHWNAWIVFVFGLTPLPYKLVTITAGVAAINFPVFIIASILARALRFFVVAWIISRWGEAAKTFIDKYFNWLAIAFVVLLIAGYLVVAGAFR